MSGILHDKIEDAQKRENKFKEFVLPQNLINSAKLQKYVVPGMDYALETKNDFLTEFNKRRIFGSAIKLTESDINLLKGIRNEIQ